MSEGESVQPLPEGWRVGMAQTYVRSFGPLEVMAHPRYGGGWTYSASLCGHYVDLFPDDPEPSFHGARTAIAAADQWLITTLIAIAGAAYDDHLIP